MSTGGRGEFHANDELMRAMGSKKGSDPIPPDQYLYFLEDPDPEQKVLAYVRSKTIRMGHRSPFCVDEHGRPITLAKLAADTGCLPSHASEYLSRLEAKGLVRTDRGKDEPGQHKELRIYLCGAVPLRSHAKANGRRTSIPCTGNCPGYLLKQINKLPDDIQQRALARIPVIEEFQKDLEAEAIAAARATAETIWDQFYSDFGLKKRKLKPATPAADDKPAKTPRSAIQISLFSVPDESFVQGNGDSVQTAAATAYGVSNGSVQRVGAGPSINTETETEKYSAAAAFSVLGGVAAAAAPTATRGEQEPHVAPVEQPATNQAIPPSGRAQANVAPILEAFRPFGIINDQAVERLRTDCLQQRPDATSEEVAAVVGDVAKTISRNARNPIGVLLREVPKFFAGESFGAWRQLRSAESDRNAEQQEAAEREQAIRVYEILNNPLSDPADLAIAQLHPSAATFEHDRIWAGALFDRDVTAALDGLDRPCTEGYRAHYNQVLRRAEEIDAKRVKELRMSRRAGANPPK